MPVWQNEIRMKKVWVVVTNDLQTDQRVNKVCLSLMNAGFQPTLLGVLHSNSLPVSRPYRTQRMRMIFKKTFFFYAEYNLRIFFKLIFSKFDMVLANDTDTLLASFLASRIRRKTIVFDAHELYTEVPELVNRPFVKRFWQSIEDLVLPHIRYAYTVCKPIADIYHNRYGIDMQIVRNAPMRTNFPEQNTKTIHFEGKKMILYQGAVNIGRGIEWVIDAMPLLDDVVFCIAGDGDSMEEIRAQIIRKNVADRVILLGRIPLEKLYYYTVSADLGLCLLENMGLNYYYSLPNRIFDFAQAGVPVLATDFPEIRNVVEKYHLGDLVSDYRPEYLADCIVKILNDDTYLSKKDDIFANARRELCWEREEENLLTIFSRFL